MNYNTVIYDNLGNPYNVYVNILDKIVIEVYKEDKTVSFLRGSDRDNVFLLDVIYVYSDYRKNGIGSTVLDILYCFIKNKRIVGNFLPFSMEGFNGTSFNELVEESRKFYYSNGFDITSKLLTKDVIDSEYEIVEGKLMKKEGCYEKRIKHTIPR